MKGETGGRDRWAVVSGLKIFNSYGSSKEGIFFPQIPGPLKR
jgi:hypothetical protein